VGMIGEARRITLRYQLSDGRAIQPTEVDGSDPVAACGGFIRSGVGSEARWPSIRSCAYRLPAGPCRQSARYPGVGSKSGNIWILVSKRKPEITQTEPVGDSSESTPHDICLRPGVSQQNRFIAGSVEFMETERCKARIGQYLRCHSY